MSFKGLGKVMLVFTILNINKTMNTRELGIYIQFVSMVSFILCYVPLAFDPYHQDFTKVDSKWQSGTHFFVSLIASIAASIPIALNSSIDLFYKLYNFTQDHHDEIIHSVPTQGTTTIYRLIMELSLVVTNLIVLALATPSNNFPLIVSLSTSRYILVANGIVLYLWRNEQITFKTSTFTASHIILSISIVLLTWDGLRDGGGGILFYTYLALTIIGLIILSFSAYPWFDRIRHIQQSILTSSQLYCTLYLIILFILYFHLFVVSIIHHNRFHLNYLTIITYFFGILGITFIIMKVRITMHETQIQENSLQMKRTFVRFVSHEIRTPLNAVNMGLELLEREFKRLDASRDLKETLAEVQSACCISLEILNDFLSYEKLEAGIMTLETSICEAWTFLIESVRPFLLQARKMNIDFELPRENSAEFTILKSAFIEIDKNRMAQVIRNLVSNAFKFTRKGGKITISTELITDTIVDKEGVRSDTKKLLRIQVIDTGVGISKENLPRIFNEIVQINPAKLQKGGGSGFGLYISKSIIDLHKGRVSVHSEGEGKGSTFTLDIPVTMRLPEYMIGSQSPNTRIEEGDDQFPMSFFASFNSPIETRRPMSSDFASLSLRSNASIHSSQSKRSSESSKKSSKSSKSVTRFSPLSKIAIDKSSLSFHGINDITQMKPPEEVDGEDDDDDEEGNNLEDEVKGFDTVTHIVEKKGLDITILVVDDAVSNRKLLSRLLQGKYSVLEAEDGQIAVNLVLDSMNTSSHIDVVLMDSQMPNMSGPLAAKTLRVSGYTGLIIGITGNTMPEDIMNFLSHGADKVLPKPVDISLLEETINDMTYFAP